MKIKLLSQRMCNNKGIIPKKGINWLLLGLGIGYSPMVMAFSPLSDVGVIRSRENAQQWSEIVSRLQVLGVDYCVLDNQNWQEETDLENVRVLLLPSVGNIRGEQVIALDSWINNGGKVIVAGPTGTSSQTEVRDRLKALFGAYWGFPVSKPSTVIVEESSISSNKQLSSTLHGGVVIPTDMNSQTSAVWLSEGQPPAVVSNENATFFGWRWGVDSVSSVTFDTAWLNIALKKYGVNTIGNLITTSSNQERLCNSPKQQEDEAYPLVPDLDTSNINNNLNLSILHQPIANLDLRSPKNKSQSSQPTLVANARLKPQSFSHQEIARMSEELKELIYRVESTLIAAEARELKYSLPMVTVVEQVMKTSSYSQSANKGNKSQIKYGNKEAYTAILEAKEVLANFSQLAANNYPQARQAWLDARRNLWDKYPVDRYFAQPEIRSIWLDRGTIVKARSKADLKKLFDSMAEGGINTVFFETVNASYPIYPSRVAPEQNPLTRGWDPLQGAIELAHERGMELHAWVWIFAAANEGHNQILNQPKNYLGPVLSRHPDWALKDQKGELFNKTPGFQKAFYDPANPQVRNYLLTLLEEIATRYDVDGIQLDYIRYPFQDSHTKQTFGYSDISRKSFKQITGVDPLKLSPSSPLWSQWTGFRLKQIDSFVAGVSSRLKQKRPNLVISAAVFPMEHRERLFKLQQNWEEWIYREWVDMLVLMTYALHTGSFEDRTKPVYDHSEKSSSLIVPGIRLLNVPDKETVDQMQSLRNMPTGGYALFAAENFNPNLQVIFKQTQGSSPQKEEPVPYRQPFQTVLARYQALQKEWNFLLINEQIAIESRYLREWSRESDLLTSKLNKLASSPSERNFLVAQSALSSFRQKLTKWTRQHQQAKPLQVKSWQNRLITLESLLKYGERTVLADNSRLARQ
jgi:uncharacterized lipoprotein YddW (UPF0748 family)